MPRKRKVYRTDSTTSDRPPRLTRLLRGLSHGLCALGRVGHLVCYGLGDAVLLARAGVLTRRVVGHLDLDGGEKGKHNDEAELREREPPDPTENFY